ncbi:Adenosine 3'-phospho 5'-phosphosulfate transporter [Fasciola hepatica]|uniref:Adenosine 3'-phospho 5'-phosphosulfate transporter 1 n=1 Tax=Fasciola hepatica TaxID=6192 RepID=A0A4E0QZK3_FASHE|nr:Adenosine 3'-phospho 5'-phosphosulfate transporter [Fasciola hepatica]
MHGTLLGQCLTASVLLLAVGSLPVGIHPDELKRSPQSWSIRLLVNSAFYLIILLPLFLLRLYLRGIGMFGKAQGEDRRCLFRCAQLCFEADISGSETKGDDGLFPSFSTTSDRKPSPSCVLRLQSSLGLHLDSNDRTPRQRCALLAICVFGLQISYVMWGVMQERIMTRDYDGQMFGSSQFLVFCNRIVTLFIVLPIHWLRLGVECNPFELGHRAPFFEFSFASVSNILSSWCQYEALKYVTFPTQVISKACKIIPVMLMGWIIQRRTYSSLEYITGGLISIGLSTFLLSDSKEWIAPPGQQHHSSWVALSGGILISGYMMMDSFTSNWQDRLFRKYHLSPVQVMAGVNLWSVLLTFFPLIYQNSLISSVKFGMEHPEFFLDVSTSAMCSAVGQLFIFFTISFFGPATFVLIMTLRMGLSLFLSYVLFGHALSSRGILGVTLVFAALFVRIYWRSNEKRAQAFQSLDAKS